MNGTWLRVEEIYYVSFSRGPVIYGRFSGRLAPGDRLVLERPDGTKLEGEVTIVPFHQRPNAEDHIAIGVGGELSTVVQVGDVLHAPDG